MSHHSPAMKTFACLALLVQLTGCAVSPATSDNSIRARLNSSDTAYVKHGHRPPAVVLQAGFGDGKKVWTAVAEDLAQDQTIFAYDRPGYGGNPASDTPRDPCTIAAELRAQLRAAGLPPPYVLVGHSLGGLYQYVFARLYPSEVAGLVLLDPTHPSHWESMQREVPTAASAIKVMSTVAFSGTERLEFDAQATCLDSLDTSRPLGVPTRLLVSGRFKPMEKGDFQAMVKRLRQDWLRLSAAPSVETIHDSGHYIQKDSPEDVAAAVRSLVAGLSGGRS
jgi:pimeloyl-ACP methyl ester carboxylesterase